MEALRQIAPATWAIVIAVVVLAAALPWIWRWYRRRRARKELIRTLTAGGIDYVSDVLVPDGMGGYFHTDFLLLTPRGILVIDLRDVRGNVFGSDQMEEWTVMDGARRYTFTNPLGGLYDRVAAVKALAGEVCVEGRIVFTARASFPKGFPKLTVLVDALSVEFPAVDRTQFSGPVAAFEEAWQRIKGSVLPSTLGQRQFG